MDLVKLLYKYINKFINSKELLASLKQIDLAKYSEDEIVKIKELIKDLEKIIKEIPNEIDEIEKKRLKEIDKLLNALNDDNIYKSLDDEGLDFIKREKDSLEKDKNVVKDGGKLYDTVVDLVDNNELINKYFDKMSNKEMLEFITEYISVPITPALTQSEFDDLVMVGIEEDKREALWRLAFNYNNKNKDFTKIVDYFILKRDAYYLEELVSAVEEDLDMEHLLKKVKETNDKDFINEIIRRGKDITYLFNDEELKKIKEFLLK